MNKRLFVILFVLCCGVPLLFYARFADNFFIYDDFENMAYAIRGLQASVFGAISLRLVPILIRYSGWLVFGTDPVGYNLLSLSVHILNIYLFFGFLHILFKDRTKAVMATAFFAATSAYADVIFWKAALPGLVSFAFVILSLKSYVMFKQGGAKKQQVLSIVYAVIAIFSKEDSAVIPFIIIFLEFIYYDGRNDLKGIVKRVLPYPAVIIFYVFVNHIVFNIIKGNPPPLATFASLHFLYSMFGGFSVFFISPQGRLVFQYWAVIPLLLTVIAVSDNEGRKLLLFSALWIIVAFLPSSLTKMCTFDINDCLSVSISRLLYLPAAGMAMIAGSGLAVLAGHGRKGLVTALLILFVWAGINTDTVWKRGKEWQEDESRPFLMGLKQNLPAISKRTWILLENYQRYMFTQWSIQSMYNNPEIYVVRDLSQIPYNEFQKAEEVYIIMYWGKGHMKVTRIK